MESKYARSGYYGVYLTESGKYLAQTWNPLTKRLVRLGLFVSAKSAAAAIDRACRTMGKAPFRGHGVRQVCKWGHPLTPDNRLSISSRQACRKCSVAYQKEYRAAYHQRRKDDPQYRARRAENMRRSRQRKKEKQLVMQEAA